MVRAKILLLVIVAAQAAWSQPTAQTPTDGEAVILVHGAWAGAWIWDDIAHRLREDGVEVHVADLTGLGSLAELIAPDIDLSVHARDVADLVDELKPLRVILVGHSYGGMVISEVASKLGDRVVALIYLDALVPLHGESAAGLIGMPYATMEEAMASGDDWWFIERHFEDTRFSRRHPTATLLQPVDFESVVRSAVPLVYIWCTESTHPPISDIAASIRSDDRWTHLEIHASHYAMLTVPDELSEMLLEVLQSKSMLR